ncbi:unnamed protein product [Amaranthus hypochondriacus]
MEILLLHPVLSSDFEGEMEAGPATHGMPNMEMPRTGVSFFAPHQPQPIQATSGVRALFTCYSLPFVHHVNI